ncbi:MAG: hypothetical protein CMI54_06380 [Parcubacteria group bacterium]|jgi:hypothetical protein|nr:hypothetical protein [Parcubacteria group bacterium]|tara:strand:+ start:3728 stop:4366 length:639 start_codon:yes stop_codon:yes gene_type:complete
MNGWLDDALGWVDDSIEDLGGWVDDTLESGIIQANEVVDGGLAWAGDLIGDVNGWVESNIWDTETDVDIVESYAKEGIDWLSDTVSEPLAVAYEWVDDFLTVWGEDTKAIIQPPPVWVDPFLKVWGEDGQKALINTENDIQQAVGSILEEGRAVVDGSINSAAAFLTSAGETITGLLDLPYEWMAERLEDIVSIPARLIMDGFRNLFFEEVE